LGIAAARAGRIRTFIIPVARIVQLLRQEPGRPQPEDLAGRAGEAPDDGEGVGNPEPLDAMWRRLEEMRRRAMGEKSRPGR